MKISKLFFCLIACTIVVSPMTLKLRKREVEVQMSQTTSEESTSQPQTSPAPVGEQQVQTGEKIVNTAATQSLEQTVAQQQSELATLESQQAASVALPASQPAGSGVFDILCLTRPIWTQKIYSFARQLITATQPGWYLFYQNKAGTVVYVRADTCGNTLCTKGVTIYYRDLWSGKFSVERNTRNNVSWFKPEQPFQTHAAVNNSQISDSSIVFSMADGVMIRSTISGENIHVLLSARTDVVGEGAACNAATNAELVNLRFDEPKATTDLPATPAVYDRPRAVCKGERGTDKITSFSTNNRTQNYDDNYQGWLYLYEVGEVRILAQRGPCRNDSRTCTRRMAISSEGDTFEIFYSGGWKTNPTQIDPEYTTGLTNPSTGQNYASAIANIKLANNVSVTLTTDSASNLGFEINIPSNAFTANGNACGYYPWWPVTAAVPSSRAQKYYAQIWPIVKTIDYVIGGNSPMIVSKNQTTMMSSIAHYPRKPVDADSPRPRSFTIQSIFEVQS